MKEYKYLLKRMPILNYDASIQVGKCYVGEVEYHGKTVSDGFDCQKFENGQLSSIEHNDFVAVWNKSNRKINKVNHVIELGGIIWTIQQYNFMDLVIAKTDIEVESIPKEIQDVILIEVTDNNKFEDKFLADNF